MAKPDPEYDATEGETTFRGVVLPLIMIGVGFSIRMIHAVYTSASAGKSLGLVICQLILSVFTMLIGCAMASMWMSLNFGPIDRAALKLAAATLCAGAAGTIIMASVGRQTHMPVDAAIIAWHVVVLCYWLFFAIFFSLELQEVLLTVCVVTMVQLGVSMTISHVLGLGEPMALFFSR